jgi:hypothetical protein
MKQFDFVKTPADQTYLGVGSGILGDYMIKLTAAGALAPGPGGNVAGAVDPAKLHDVIVKITYSLAP